MALIHSIGIGKTIAFIDAMEQYKKLHPHEDIDRFLIIKPHSIFTEYFHTIVNHMMSNLETKHVIRESQTIHITPELSSSAPSTVTTQGQRSQIEHLMFGQHIMPKIRSQKIKKYQNKYQNKPVFFLRNIF